MVLLDCIGTNRTNNVEGVSKLGHQTSGVGFFTLKQQKVSHKNVFENASLDRKPSLLNVSLVKTFFFNLYNLEIRLECLGKPHKNY